MEEQIFFFKLISIGDFCMQFDNSNNVQNKPIVNINDKMKKWGNSYIVFNNVQLETVENINIDNPMFAGKFEIDKNLNNYLKLFKRIDVPCKKADYYIVARNTVTKNRIDGDNNLIKYHSNSHSRIFSSAYHQTEKSCLSQTIYILQDGDIILTDGVKEQWDSDKLDFVTT